MEEFWIYENWTHKRVRIHRAECGYCNNGRGTQATHSGRNDKWHGPYSNRSKAISEAVLLKQPDTKRCGTCDP